MHRQCIPGRLSQLRAAWNRGYASSYHKNITGNILSPENYPLYGIHYTIIPATKNRTKLLNCFFIPMQQVRFSMLVSIKSLYVCVVPQYAANGFQGNKLLHGNLCHKQFIGRPCI